MNKMLRNICLAALVLAAACGPKKAGKIVTPAPRPFPPVEIPALITEPTERTEYALLHYWDKYFAASYPSDSLHLNGVSLADMKEQMGIFSSALRQVSPAVSEQAMVRLFEGLESAQRAQPGGRLLPDMAQLVRDYLYDPTSLLRNEEFYLPFVSRMAVSDQVDPARKPGYEWDTRMCSLNRPGTRAADFVFVDTEGRKRSLFGIQAEYTLLIFGNPDCTACRELMEDMSALPDVTALIQTGRLKVVDIYIDQDIELWKQRMAAYPAAWINGYDPHFTIRTDVSYNVRALPSIYLLDRDKTVLLKDAEPSDALDLLVALAQ